jgi:peptidoglycan/xylan/chitin deacetylase (PgdA/CDA1 family)
VLLALILAVLAVATPLPAPTLPPVFVPPPILMYHRVDVDRPGDRVGRELTVSPAQFEEQLAYLKANGIAGISMAQLEQRLELGDSLDRAVVLTFDDGYADQYAYAVPLLRRYGDSATFYIVTGNVGRRGHVTWPELQAMAAEHMDIAAHGVQHDDLSLMSPAQQALQIDDSIKELRERLKMPIDSYAYPSGRFNSETLELVREADVPLAVTTDPSYVIAPETRLELPRLRVRSDWTLAQFATAVEGAPRNIARSPVVLSACGHSPRRYSQRSLPCR